MPIQLNLNINGPFRALIQMAKAFKDPTQVIAPVMPFPIDSPALKVEVRTTKTEDQTTQTGRARPRLQPSHHHPEEPSDESWTRAAQLAAGIAAALPLTGCITVKAPDKPIEINLNVNISQQVVVRLQPDVQQMIQQNPQAFPPRADEAMKRLAVLIAACGLVAAPAGAQSPVVSPAIQAGQVRRALRRLHGRRRQWFGEPAAPGLRDQHPPAQPLHRPRVAPERDCRGRRHWRQLASSSPDWRPVRPTC